MSELRRRSSPLHGVGGRLLPLGVLELLAEFYFGNDDVLTILFLRLVFLVCFFVFSSLSVLVVSVSRDHAVIRYDLCWLSPQVLGPWAIHDSGYHGSRITTPSGCKSQFCVQLLISPCREFAFRYTVLYGDGPNLSHFISHGKSEL